jgi:RNA polymerase sigma-70 factor, ECF subfamily
MTASCLLAAWSHHEAELRSYLRRRLSDPAEADDLLQELFLKACLQGQAFCSVLNVRAWLFKVARNVLMDHFRRTRALLPLPDDLPAAEPDDAAIDQLAQCLPRVLSELSADDREAISLCDLGGMPQAAFAKMKGLSLPGAKSRVQRARERLRERMSQACQVQLDEAGHVCCFVPRTPGK